MSRFRRAPVGVVSDDEYSASSERVAQLAAEADKAERAVQEYRRAEREAMMELNADLAAANDAARADIAAVTAERDELATRLRELSEAQRELEAETQQRAEAHQAKLEAHIERAGQAMLEVRAELEQELAESRAQLAQAKRERDEVAACLLYTSPSPRD